MRNLIGPYCTSLDMTGISITLLKVDDELMTLWDAPFTPRPCVAAAEEYSC